MPISEKDLDNWFTYHSPRGHQPEQYEAIRQSGRRLAQTILDNAPDSADRTTAIRAVRQAVMWANVAIACEEGS